MMGTFQICFLQYSNDNNRPCIIWSSEDGYLTTRLISYHAYRHFRSCEKLFPPKNIGNNMSTVTKIWQKSELKKTK